MRLRSAQSLFLVAISLGFLTSCATVKVRKIPTPTQYSLWTDDMQRKADEMEGFRFYLPRPFVSVTESFPIRADIYIADGTLTPDGKYVIVQTVRPLSGLNEYLAGVKADTVIPTQQIAPPNAERAADTANAIKAQSGAIQDLAKAMTNQPGTVVKTGGTDTSKPASTPTAPAQPSTGINKRDVHNDNGAFAYQPMRGSMDIAYLPDFEEQYAVSSRSGLGNAQFSLNLGQGWSLQSFSSLADNSELNKRIFDVIDESIKLAKAAGESAMGVPPVDVSKLFSAESGAPVSNAAAEKAGAPVSLKITVIHYAAKGLYPVIKPRELQERLASKDGKYYLWYDLFRVIPRCTPASAFDPAAIQRAASAAEATKETSRFSVPRYPYQYIAFNTFRYMVIETVRTDTKPFATRYDPTGVGSSTSETVSAASSGVGGTPPEQTVLNNFLKNLKGAVLTVNDTPNAFVVTDAKADETTTFKITLDAGSDSSGTKYPIEQVYAVLKMMATRANLPQKFSEAIGSKTVTLTDKAQPRIATDGGAPKVPGQATPTPSPAVKASDIQSFVNQQKIPSGDNPDTAFFSFSKATFDDSNGELNVTPVPNGVIKPQFSEPELAKALQDKVNTKFNKTVVKSVKLDQTAVADLKNAGKIKAN